MMFYITVLQSEENINSINSNEWLIWNSLDKLTHDSFLLYEKTFHVTNSCIITFITLLSEQ